MSQRKFEPRTWPKMPDTSFLEATLIPTLIRVQPLPAQYDDNNGLRFVPFEFEPANDMEGKQRGREGTRVVWCEEEEKGRRSPENTPRPFCSSLG
ncbi:hypothetical protein SH449x_001960 [Pirellulaceae bacterium SH449]